MNEREHCGVCKGTGVVDSGGFTPWGTSIDVPCPECRGRNVVHANLGECFVSDVCLQLQRTNPDTTSMYVFHDGDIKEVTKALVTETDFQRASGDCICDWCQKKYYEHPRYVREQWSSKIGADSEHPTYPLRQLSDGSLVKL